MIGDDAIEIREGDDLFPRGGQTERIPTLIEGLRRDAAGNADPSPAKMETVTFRIGEHRPDGLLAEFFQTLDPDERFSLGETWLHDNPTP